MVSAKGLELKQESRVKPGLLPWLNVQLSLSFIISPVVCSSLTGNQTCSPGPYSGARMLCQHFSGPRAGGEGLVQGQQTWPKRENISHTQTPHPAEPLERKSGKDSEMGIPSPISPSPAQAPEKQAILGETPVVPIPIPAPSGGSEMQGETELERQSEMQGPEAKKQTKTETGRHRQLKETDRQTSSIDH